MIDYALPGGGLVSRERSALPFIPSNQGSVLQRRPEPIMSALSAAINQHLQRGPMSPRMPPPLALEFTSRAPASYMLPTCAPGFPELFVQFRCAPTQHNMPEELGRKAHAELDQGLHHPLPFGPLPFALHKRVQEI